MKKLLLITLISGFLFSLTAFAKECEKQCDSNERSNGGTCSKVPEGQAVDEEGGTGGSGANVVDTPSDGN
jgi:hypothetical protein